MLAAAGCVEILKLGSRRLSLALGCEAAVQKKWWPCHHQGVDQEGVEPSSKRGNNMLSTRLASYSLSGRQKAEAATYQPYLQEISPFDLELPQGMSRYNCTAGSSRLGTQGAWAMSRPRTSSAGIKLTY